MKNSKGLLYGIISLLIFLSACSSGTVEKSTDTPVNEDAISKEETVTKEEIVVPDMNLDDMRAMVDQYFEDLTNVYINAGKQFNLAEKPLTEEIYQSMAEEFKAYGTDHMIETQLHEIALEFCYAGCDVGYFPYNSSLGLRYEMKDDQNGMVKLNYIIPEDELNGSVKVSVTLIYEDNNWKIDSFQQSAIDDLALTEDESGWLMQESGYGRSQFDGERTIEGFGSVYVYQLLDENRSVGVVKDTGFIVDQLDETTNLVEEAPSPKADASSHKNKFTQKMLNLEKELTWIDDQYDILSVAEMYDLEEMRYQEWDDLLNEIYGVLKSVLSSAEMDALTVAQRDWIVYRDNKAEKGTDQLGGGWQSLQRMINLGDITKERCYELVEEYL